MPILRLERLGLVLCTTARFDELMDEARREAFGAGMDHQRRITNVQFTTLFRENMNMRRELGRLPTPNRERDR